MQIRLSTGIGDVLCLESFLTDQEVAEITDIYWAAKCRALLIPLFEKTPEWQHVRHVIDWHEDGYGAACYGPDGRQPGACPDDVIDWSIVPQWADLRTRPHRGSRILAATHTNLDCLDLPDRYLVCQPSTPYNGPVERQKRDYTAADWRETIEYARRRRLKIVVLNSPEAEPAPTHPLILDWQGKTSLGESLEILKRARCYVGIDSWLACMAARLLPPDRCQIRCVNTWAIMCRNIYYPGAELRKKIEAH